MKRLQSLLSSQFLTALLVGVMGLLGVWTGAYLTANEAERLWQKQQRAIKIDNILNKRIELIERVTKLSNSKDKYIAYQGFIELQAGLAQECVSREEKADECSVLEPATSVTELSIKRADLNAEFSSTIQMVTLYFNCDARKIADKLANTTNWW